MVLTEITVSAPINMALIKYWGKRDEALILPCNSSISLTLESPDLLTITSVRTGPELQEDCFWLDGHKEVLDGRLKACIEKARSKARVYYNGTTADPDWKLHIKSRNSVPTSAGLASSASGFAALAHCLLTLYKLDTFESLEKLSVIARVGSGSACRSLFGGLVQWDRGEAADGSDSIARQLFSEEFWGDLACLILVFDEGKKMVSSTSGMQATVQTSSLFTQRINQVVPERLHQILAAFNSKDFSSLGNLIMQDSNQFHACCLDTFPPIFYLNDCSRIAINLVHQFNTKKGRIAVAYSFDAGPNAAIFGRKTDLKEFGEFFKTRLGHLEMGERLLHEIYCSIGPGPQILPNSSSLFN